MANIIEEIKTFFKTLTQPTEENTVNLEGLLIDSDLSPEARTEIWKVYNGEEEKSNSRFKAVKETINHSQAFEKAVNKKQEVKNEKRKIIEK